MAHPFRGIFPILATCFHPNGRIDYASQERLIDFCIAGGVHGLVALANASEGHLLSDREKHDLLSHVLKKVDGRVPVVATINHPSAVVAEQKAREAQKLGAAAIMSLPPFFGRWRAGNAEISRHFEIMNRAVDIPIILQDHVLSDISLSVGDLVALAERFEHLAYVKLESGNIIHKARTLLAAANEGKLAGVFGGNSGIFLPEEVEAGCCGTMPACYMPEVFRKTWDLLESGNIEEAHTYFAPFSRLTAYEKEVANRCVWKALLVERGIIANGAVREPIPAFADGWQRDQLLRVAGRSGLFVQ